MINIYTGNYSHVKKYLIATEHRYWLHDTHQLNVDKDYLQRLTPEDTVLVSPLALSSENAQYELGLLLCSLDKNINIFTHSSALINGLRVGLKKGLMQPQELSVMFFSADEEEHKIIFDKDGRSINNFWPDGFMDVWDKALEELID